MLNHRKESIAPTTTKQKAEISSKPWLNDIKPIAAYTIDIIPPERPSSPSILEVAKTDMNTRIKNGINIKPNS